MGLLRTTQTLAGLFALGAVLSACAGDSPEAMQQELSNAAPVLAYFDEEHAPCAAEAILTNVGFEQLAENGFTSDGLAVEPTVIETIVDAHNSDDLRSGFIDCLDVDAAFRTHLAEQLDIDLIECDAAFAPGNALVDAYLTQRFDGIDRDLVIADTEDNRDMLRPCVPEAAFGSTFGIDLADDLIVAIDAELDDTLSSSDGDPCVGSALLDELGSAEAANELGITVDDPSFTLTSIGLSGEELDDFMLDLFNCGSFDDLKVAELRLTEPTFGPCVIDELRAEQEWKLASVRGAFGVDNAIKNVESRESNALDDCLLMKVTELYGEPERGEFGWSKDFAEGLYGSIVALDPGIERFGATLSETSCASFGALQGEDIDEWAGHILRFEVDGIDPPAWVIEQAEAIVSKMALELRTCSGDFVYGMGDLQRAGFSDETLECVLAKSPAEDAADALDWFVTFDDSMSYVEADGIISSLFDAVDRCYSPDEAEMYDDWIAWIDSEYSDDFGVVGDGENELTST